MLSSKDTQKDQEQSDKDSLLLSLFLGSFSLVNKIILCITKFKYQIVHIFLKYTICNFHNMFVLNTLPQKLFIYT